MFYTLPEYEFTPGGVDFSELGAEPGTKVWRAVRLTIPKFWFVVEFQGGERDSLTQTVLCAETEAVLDLVGEDWIERQHVTLCVPAALSPSGALSMAGLKEVWRGTYRTSLFKPPKPAFVFVTDDDRRYVEIAGLNESDIRDVERVYFRDEEVPA
jgi:hypothetical protein